MKSSIERYKLEGKKFVVFFMCGLPGSGKSTWAKEYHGDLPVVSRDAVRAKLGYTSSVDEKAVLTNGQEQEVSQEENYQIAKLALKKQSFVLDDTNTVPKYRKNMLASLRSYGAHIIGVNMNTPVETCIERRRGQIPAEAIRRISARLQPLKEEDVDELINANGY